MKTILILCDNPFLKRTVVDLFPNKREYTIAHGILKRDIDIREVGSILVDIDSIDLTLLHEVLVDRPTLCDKIILMVSTITIKEIEFLKRLNIKNIIKKPFNTKTLQDKLNKVLKQ